MGINTQVRSSVCRTLFFTAGVISILLSPGARAAAITFNTALPVSRHEFILREQLVVSAQAIFDRQTLNTVVGYGVTPRLALFGVLPVTRVEVDDRPDRDFGLADASLFARYEVMRRDAPGATFRLAPFAGVRLPSATADLLGDGSTDATLGLVATSASTKRIIDAQIGMILNGSNDGGRAGHRGSLDLSLQYRAWPAQLSTRTPGFVYAVIESSLSYQGRSRTEEGRLDDAGWQWFLIPGVQYVRQRWIADLAVKIPVATHLDPAASRTDYSVFASIRVNF